MFTFLSQDVPGMVSLLFNLEHLTTMFMAIITDKASSEGRKDYLWSASKVSQRSKL